MKIALWLAVLSCVLTAGVAFADTPQFTVQAAHYSFTAYNQSTTGWTCDAQADLNHGPGCYGTYPASAVFGESQVISQNPGSTGTIVWHTNPSPVRDGGFLDPQAYDKLTSWVANGPQGGPHKLRQVLYEHESGITDLDLDNTRFVNNSAFYEPTTGSHIISTSVYESAQFPTNPMSGLYIVESFSGYDNFFWYEIFRSIRPNGTDGAEWHFNKAALVNDPSNLFRWIGFVKASHPTMDNVITPFYIDFDRHVFGFKFVNEGWCEWPWGTRFTDYNTSATCNPSVPTIPDVFAGVGNPYPNDFKTLAVINGKVIALRSRGATQGAYVAGDALCPPEDIGFNVDHDLYATRSRDPNYPFRGARTFHTREVALDTWSTASGVHWVGNQKQILNGGQPQLFSIQPTDSLALGGFSATLHQYNNGGVYLYLDAKLTLCEPDSNPSGAKWDRFPIKSSGGGIVWFRLGLS